MPDELAPIDAAMEALGEDLAALVEPQHPDEQLVDYYSRRTTELAADEAAIEAKFDMLEQSLMAARQGMLADIDRRHKALDWHAGAEVRRIVADAIAGKKVRHIKTPWGTLGYRTRPGRTSLVVDDEAAAIQWAEKELPGAVTLVPELNKAAVKEAIANGAAVPGTRMDVTDPEDVFEAKAAKLNVLPMTGEQKGLE